MSQRTETAYKAVSPGKSAQHDKALDSRDTVNAAVAQSQFTSLSGETCPVCNSFGSGARHANMPGAGQESAEAIVGKGLHHLGRCGDWERARYREPGWTHPAEGPNLKKGMSGFMSSESR